MTALLAKIASNRLASSLILVVAIAVTTTAAMTLFAPAQKVAPGLTYSDKRAAVAMLVLVGSTTIWTVVFLTNTIHPFPPLQLSRIAKSIDLIWYPLGIGTAILAVAGTENAILERQIGQEAIIASNASVRAQQDFAAARSSCRYFHEERLDILVNLQVQIDQQFYGQLESLDLLCSDSMLLAKRFIRKSSLDGSDATRNLDRISIARILTFRFEKENDLQIACFDLMSRTPGLGEPTPTTWSIRLRKVNYLGPQAHVFAANTHVELDPIFLFCTNVITARLRTDLLPFFRQVIEGRDLTVKNPWIWVVILAFLAGLKLTKSIIELRLTFVKK